MSIFTDKTVPVVMKGPMEYHAAMEMQEQEKQLILEGKSSGKIFLLEHNPPVVTLGRHGNPADILVPESVLKRNGFSVVHTDRGGNATVHEPGQLVIYFVLPVSGMAAREFVQAALERCIRPLNSGLGLDLYYDPALPGIWHRDGNICLKCGSAGFSLRNGVSTHGVAVNICNDMKGFSFINPCGMESSVMTSISRITGKNITVQEAAELIAGCTEK